MRVLTRTPPLCSPTLPCVAGGQFGLILFELYTREEIFVEELRAGMTVEQILFAMTEQDLRPQFFVARSGSKQLSGARRVSALQLSIHMAPADDDAAAPETADTAVPRRELKRVISARRRTFAESGRTEVQKEVRSLAADCWHRNATRRPTFSEVQDVLQSILKIHHENLLENDLSERTILHDVLPAHVVETLKAGRKVLPESFEHTTIFFSDIVGCVLPPTSSSHSTAGLWVWSPLPPLNSSLVRIACWAGGACCRRKITDGSRPAPPHAQLHGHIRDTQAGGCDGHARSPLCAERSTSKL